MVKAVLKNYRQSARKVRLVANALRGKKVDTAITNLQFIAKRSALPLQKLIESAKANATNNFGMDSTDLFIKTITVDEGYTIKRWRPRARGAAFPINKRTSIVTVILDSKKGVKKSAKNKKESSKADLPKKEETKVKTTTKKPVSKAKKTMSSKTKTKNNKK